MHVVVARKSVRLGAVLIGDRGTFPGAPEPHVEGGAGLYVDRNQHATEVAVTEFNGEDACDLRPRCETTVRASSPQMRARPWRRRGRR